MGGIFHIRLCSSPWTLPHTNSFRLPFFSVVVTFRASICSLPLFLFMTGKKIDYVFFFQSNGQVVEIQLLFNWVPLEIRHTFATLIRIILIVWNWIVVVGIVNFHSYQNHSTNDHSSWYFIHKVMMWSFFFVSTVT